MPSTGTGSGHMLITIGCSRSIHGQANNRINPTVGPVTGLATAARPAPVPSAGYAERRAARRLSDATW